MWGCYTYSVRRKLLSPVAGVIQEPWAGHSTRGGEAEVLQQVPQELAKATGQGRRTANCTAHAEAKQASMTSDNARTYSEAASDKASMHLWCTSKPHAKQTAANMH